MTTIVDLGVGNLGNVARAIQHLGGTAEVTADPGVIAASRRLILPGVGAFSPPREALRGEIETALRAALAEGAWLLGICVGFQLLFEESEEFGTTDGLSQLPGRIVRLPDGVPLPHIGWNRLHDLADHPLLAGLAPDPWVYFVHSFAPEGSDAVTLARTTHGRSFTAVAGRGRVLGCQFHPERSGATGLKILANFLALGREDA
ncbi:MAG TPA: imidazole glycerol phosphate synthase subunit HisH [Thermoanaerobaculia bacterium]|jgi:glutamine amidotransferase|nr:imidazole glycerol phosphate synthase subunit HisH [Thermoanaerobaculia bacterium]